MGKGMGKGAVPASLVQGPVAALPPRIFYSVSAYSGRVFLYDSNKTFLEENVSPETLQVRRDSFIELN